MYKKTMMIDGVLIDIIIMSIDYLEQDIIYSNVKGSTYFDAVLKNDIVLLNKMNMYDN